MFGRKKKIVEKVAIKKESHLLYDENKKINSDIKYLEKEYSNYLLSSLSSEYESYKTSLDKSKSVSLDVSDCTHWVITDYLTSSFKLKKTPDKSKTYKYISINIDFDYSDEVLKLKSARLSSPIYFDLKIDSFEEIISKYFLSRVIKKSKDNLSVTKGSFENLLSLIGKDTHRDIKIEEILNDNI